MIHLRLFGTPSLMIEEKPVLGRSAQRKRMAFLAILAEAHPAGVSRDRVLGLLWPRSDPGRARRVLSEALYVLKKELGEGVILLRGEDMALNPDLIWCDLIALREALDEGRYADAVALHLGPFMEDFALDGAPEFEHWSDGVREKVTGRHREALRSLAEGAASRGDHAEAIQHYRSLAALDPFSSVTAMGLMRSLAAAGDRAAALTHARIHAQLLRNEFDANPSPDVEALASELRETPDSVTPPPTSVPTPAEADEGTDVGAPVPPDPSPDPVAPAPVAPAPEVSGSSRRPRPSRALIGSVALVAAVAVAVILAWAGGSGPGDASGDDPGIPRLGRAVDPPVLVAVYPVAVTPAEGPARTAASQAAQLLRMDLEIGNVRAADAGLVARAYEGVGRSGVLGLGERSPPTRDELSDATERSGWDLFVVAEMVLTGEHAVLDAELRAPSDAGPIATAHAEGPATELRSLASELTTQLLEGYAVRSGLTTTPQARMSTGSLDALGHWLEGEDAFLEGRYREAVAGFEAATDADPEFAWAWYRLSASYLYSLRFLDAHAAARRASQLSASLPAHRATLVLAWEDFLAGNVDEAEAGFARVLEVDPDDPEALFGLGEVRSHYNALTGRPPEEANAQFEGVLAVYDRHGESIHHLLETAAREGDWVRFEDLMSRLPEGSDQLPAWRAVMAYGSPGPEGGAGGAEDGMRAAALQGLRGSDPLIVAIAAGRVAAHVHAFRGAEEISEILRASALPGWRAAGWVVAAQARAAAGDFDGAGTALDRLREYQPTWATEFEALFALLYQDWAPDEWDLDALAVALETMDLEPDLSEALLFLVHAGEHDEIGLYLRGAVEIARGDPSAVDPSRLIREATGEGPTSVGLAAELAASQRGMLRLASGDTAWALDAFRFTAGSEGRLGAVERVGLSPFFSHVLDRWYAARLLATRPGNEEEALLWLSGLTDGFDVLVSAPAHREKARLLERMGRPEEARREYEAFLREWTGVRPGSRAADAVAEAEMALNRLVEGSVPRP